MFFPRETAKTVWRFKEKILLLYSDDLANLVLLFRVAPTRQTPHQPAHLSTAHLWPVYKVATTLGHVKGHRVVVHDFLFKNIYFGLCWVFITTCGLSLVVASWDYSLIVVYGLIIVVASLVVEHRLKGTQVSVVVVHGLDCPMACGIFPDQGLNLCLLHWQADS